MVSNFKVWIWNIVPNLKITSISRTSLAHLDIIFLNICRLDILGWRSWGDLSWPLCLRLSWCLSVSWSISWSSQKICCIIYNSFLSLDTNFGLEFEQCTHTAFLLADKRHGFQLILPFLCELDWVHFDLFWRNSVSLSICMLNHSLDLLRMDGIPHIIHIGFITLRAFWELLWKVHFHISLAWDFGVLILNTDFIICWRIAEFDLAHFEELLSSSEYLFHMIFCNLLVW